MLCPQWVESGHWSCQTLWNAKGTKLTRIVFALACVIMHPAARLIISLAVGTATLLAIYFAVIYVAVPFTMGAPMRAEFSLRSAAYLLVILVPALQIWVISKTVDDVGMTLRTLVGVFLLLLCSVALMLARA